MSENVVVPIPTLGDGPEGIRRLVAFLRSLESAGRLESVAVVVGLEGGNVASFWVEPEEGDRYRLTYGASQLSRRLTEDQP